ncbi:MAG: hypothetical protein ABIQ30_16945 [Devosia sp.]
MKFTSMAKIAGALALTFSLAGCIDMTEDILVTSTTTAKATITQTMGADIYAMVKAAEEGGSDSKPFCKGTGETLTDNDDKSGTCVIISEGAFADLTYGDDDSTGKPIFKDNGDGTVRVSIVTKGMMGDMGAEGQDAETAAMLKQMFDGHFLTIRFGGSEIVETNMEKTAEGNYAETKIPFTGLLDGTAKLPDELYAVVKP